MARKGTNSDPAAQGRHKQRERARELQRQQDVAVIMKLPEGRRIMWELLFDKCGLMDVYLPDNSGIYRHEGRRSVGLELARELQKDHKEQYSLMIAERMQAQTKDEAVREELARSEDPEEPDDAS
jgi:hypothetical protein